MQLPPSIPARVAAAFLAVPAPPPPPGGEPGARRGAGAPAPALAPPASAGTYTVRACGDDGVNRAFWSFANPGLSAPASCPATDYEGLTTGLAGRAERNAGGGRLPNGASAWQIFEAPPGARLDSITFRPSGGRASGCWAFGAFAWDGEAFHPGEQVW